MKKLTKQEMQNVSGGAAVTYSDVCIGTWSFHKRRHETTVSGSHATSLRQAKINFNSNLAKHKVNGAMINHTHSLDPVAV